MTTMTSSHPTTPAGFRVARRAVKLGFTETCRLISAPPTSRTGCFTNITERPGIYVCPTDRYLVKRGGINYPTTRSYSMVSEMGRDKQKYSTIFDPKPVRALVFFEEDDNLNNPANGINDGNIGLRSYPTEAWGDSPARRHDNGAVVSMADGHVEYWKWKSNGKTFARGPVNKGRGGGVSPGNNGFVEDTAGPSRLQRVAGILSHRVAIDPKQSRSYLRLRARGRRLPPQGGDCCEQYSLSR